MIYPCYIVKTTALSFTSAVLQTFIMYPDSNNVFLTANTQNKVRCSANDPECLE